MKKRKKGVNNSTIKHKNQTLILDKIKEEGAISRAQLSKNLGLSAPSVSKNIEILLDKGIIIEAGVGKSSGGRKPVVLKYNYDFCYIIGITLKEDELRGVLTKLNGEIITEYKINKNFKSFNQNTILKEIKNCISHISKKSQIGFELIKSIVISLPGIIEDNEIKVSNILPQLQGNRLGEEIVNEFDIDVLIKNDINSKVVGEYWKLSEAYENLVYISPEKTGVGSGIIIDGKLYEGSSFGAGEVGYMLFNVEDLLSNNYKANYLENIVSRDSITEYIHNIMLKDGNSSTEILMDSDKILDYELLRKEAESNNQIALNVYDYLARYFAVTIHNIATILNPDTIILGGNFITLGQIMYEKIKKYLNLISIIPIDIRLSKIDYNAQLYGSIYFGMRYIDEKILSI